MPVVSVRDLDIYFERRGRGPGMLFISGTGGDLRIRPNVLDGPLVKHFDVLAYDQRGLGQTSKPPGPYTMEDYGDDAAALLDALGWQCVPVMGVSFGGMVAQELALRHPDRVSLLVLACTSAGGAGGASFPLHELEDLPEAQRVARHLEIADLRRDAAWQAEHPQRWSELLDMARQRQPVNRHDPGALRQLEARAGHDTWVRLPGIGVPVLLAGGQFDGIAPARNMEALARQIPGAELRFFNGGHLFLIQDKAAYPYIIQWVAGELEKMSGRGGPGRNSHA